MDPDHKKAVTSDEASNLNYSLTRERNLVKRFSGSWGECEIHRELNEAGKPVCIVDIFMHNKESKLIHRKKYNISEEIPNETKRLKASSGNVATTILIKSPNTCTLHLDITSKPKGLDFIRDKILEIKGSPQVINRENDWSIEISRIDNQSLLITKGGSKIKNPIVEHVNWQ